APFHHSLQFATTYETYVVLKGKFTIITTPNGDQVVDTTGNQGLAKGGSGDVLTGVILAMVLQEQSTLDALCNACFIHGKSANLEVSFKRTYYDLVDSDVIEGIADVYRTFMYLVRRWPCSFCPLELRQGRYVHAKKVFSEYPRRLWARFVTICLW